MNDGGRSSENGLQDQFSNRPSLRGDESQVVSRSGKRQGLTLSGVDWEPVQGLESDVVR
jgi:hypothetical protein